MSLSINVKIYIHRTSAEISHFTAGLEEVFGLWTVMKQHPDVCLPLLSFVPQALSKRQFGELFKTAFSSIGSNRRRQEEETIYAWEMFLQDVDGIYFRLMSSLLLAKFLNYIHQMQLAVYALDIAHDIRNRQTSNMCLYCFQNKCSLPEHLV
ncbi:MAG: hypothetical protein ABW185_28035 [Sedimenticola sp.]